MIMRQHFVPRISFHTELEVIIPDVSRNAFLDEPCRHMVIEFFSLLEDMPQGRTQALRPPDKFGDRIEELFVITRLVSLDRRTDRRYDIFGPRIASTGRSRCWCSQSLPS